MKLIPLKDPVSALPELTAADRDVLLAGEPDCDYQRLLHWLYEQELAIECDCKIVRRAARVKLTCRYYLWRKGGQQPAGDTICEICERLSDRPDDMGQRQRVPISMGLRLPLTFPNPDHGSLREHPGGGKSGPAYARALGVLLNVLERAGTQRVCSPQAGVRESAFLDKVWGVLETSPLYPDVPLSVATISDFAHLPGGYVDGGLLGLIRRMRAMWPDSTSRPLMWALGFATCYGSENSDRIITVERLSREYESHLRAEGRWVGDPFVFRVPQIKVKMQVRTGPYFGLVVCTLEDGVSLGRAALKPELAALAAIADRDLQVIVDSDLERGAVGAMRDWNVPFRKPLFDEEDGLKLDFIFNSPETTVELHGRWNCPAYRAQKEEQLKRRAASVLYQTYRHIVYVPRRNDDFSALRQLIFDRSNTVYTSPSQGLRLKPGEGAVYDFSARDRGHFALRSDARKLVAPLSPARPITKW